MPRKFMLLITFLVSLLMTVLALAAMDQTPAIDPQVIGGGGGHLEQGDLSLDLTLGQPVVGVDTAGAVEVCAGFWCGAGLGDPITDIDLAVTSPGMIYTDTVVEFTAHLTPTYAQMPYTYTIAGGAQQTSTVNPLVFTQTFAATGVQTVTLAAWNGVMRHLDAVTDSVTFTVYAPESNVALDSVTIEGETSGAPGVYTFTAATAPLDAATPITYLWDNGDATVSTTRTLVALGRHTLAVTVTNPVNTVTDTHTITIDEALNYIYLPLVMRGD